MNIFVLAVFLLVLVVCPSARGEELTDPCVPGRKSCSERSIDFELVCNPKGQVVEVFCENSFTCRDGQCRRHILVGDE